jgi:hypothetical protein
MENALSGREAIEALARSEIDLGVELAMKYPRSISQFLAKSKEDACRSVETAASCIYSKPIGGGAVTGPSVRLAEILRANYKHLRTAARHLSTDRDNMTVTCQAICYDLENNNQIMDEVTASIRDRSGKIYSNDVIITTIAATKSKAVRNVILQAIPRAYADEVMVEAKKAITGENKKGGKAKETLADQIQRAIKHFTALGVPKERILHRFGRQSDGDITRDDMVVLVGFVTALNEPGNEVSLDEMFPAPPKVDTPRLGKKAPTGQEVQEAQVREPEPIGTADIFS